MLLETEVIADIYLELTICQMSIHISLYIFDMYIADEEIEAARLSSLPPFPPRCPVSRARVRDLEE